MSLRFKAEDLDGLKPNVRAQLERHLGNCDSVEMPPNELLAPGLKPGKVVRAVPQRKEEEVGRMLTEWIDLVVLPNGLRPGLFFFHVPNGLARTATQGGIFKAQGLRKGWPDYGLDLPVGRYHGFRLEIKSDDGAKPTSDQLDILARLESVGFKCGVAWGFDDSKRQLQEYWRELVDSPA